MQGWFPSPLLPPIPYWRCCPSLDAAAQEAYDASVDQGISRRLGQFISFCSVLAVAFGLWVLTGWMLHVQSMKSILSRQVAIKANTGACCILIGFALWILRKERPSAALGWSLAAKLAATLAGLVGLLSLLEGLYGWDLGIDHLLITTGADDLALHALRRENLANRIVTVRDGEEAIDFLFCNGSFSDRSFDHPPRLVLLDLKLPKVDGMEVLRRLKEDPRTRTIPVVILTSSKEERDLISGYNLGANSYIQKPVDFDQFRETVKQVGFYWLVVNEAVVPKGLSTAAGKV